MNRQNHLIYRLDGIEIDTAQACLKRDGKEQHLRQQTFQVLIYLLENRQRLITKNELIEGIWQDTAVTDNALEQCLAEIRKVLGDDSRNPRFIKTVPRAGYRFIGSLEEVCLDPSEAVETKEVPAIVLAERRRKPVAVAEPQVLGTAKNKQQAVLISILVILISAAAVGLYFIQRGWSPQGSLASVTLPEVTGKRTIAVMFFDNQSGSADLDWLREGLTDMLITDLSNSNQLTVLSRQQLHLLLERIGHKELEQIKLDEALDVARRSQAKIVVLGSFARLGEQIRIDVHLHDARDGQLLAAERLVVDQPAQILTQLDLLSLRLASHLGVSPAAPEAGTGLTSVMTDNLEAYRYYSLAVEKAQGLQNTEAIALLQKAINLDPQFAMAYARIGYVYGVTGSEPDKAKPYLQKGFQLSHRLTERDKLYINAWYAIANLDSSDAINSFRGIIFHYPLEVEAYWRLARVLTGKRRYEEALEIAKQGLVMDPGAKDLYNTLGGIYIDLGRHDEAIAMYRRYVELGPEEPNAHDSLGLAYQWAGRYSEAIEEYQRALALKPDFAIPSVHLGNTYFQQGRYQEASSQYQSYFRSASSDNYRARAWHSISVVSWNERKLTETERAAKEEVKYDKNGVGDLLRVTLERNDRAAAEKFEKILESNLLPERPDRGATRELFFYRGYFEFKTGRGAEAVESFRQALKQRPVIWDVDPLEDCLANAYLELGRLDEAIAEYERILRLNPNYPLAHYHLGQAYERQGLRNQARTEYESFLQVWKNADPDIPEVVAAKMVLGNLTQ
jgi:tetratricopeptide (TPR) repeat protein/DNA-binding winged helix-turn-helix (wHTH) protein